jgi:HK97 family phage portal protein
VTLRARLSAAWRALGGFPTPAGGDVVPNWPSWLLNHPYRLEHHDLDHAKAVRFVSIVRVCVLRRAEDIASQPVIFERETSSGWEPVARTKGNIVDVWYAGNPRQTGTEVIRDLHANYKTHGRAYLVAETFGMKSPSELWVLPSHLVRVVPGPRRMPEFYVYQRGHEEAIPAENVIAWHDFQPEDLPVGASVLDSVQLQYETRYDLIRLFQKVIQNGGSAAGFFSVIQPTNGIPAVLKDSEKEAIAKAIRRGRKNPDLPTILDQLSYERMGLTMQELQLIESAKLADADICRAMGVPPWLVGIKEGATGHSGSSAGSSAQADERIYWMNLKVETDIRDRMLTEKLAPMFGEDGVRVRTDFSGVPAINAPLLNAAQQAVALCGRPPLSVNEVRGLAGLTPFDDPAADELYEPPIIVPVGDPTGEKAPADSPSDGDPAKDTKPAAKSKRFIDTPERAERWRAKDSLVRQFEAKFERAFAGLIRERKKKLLARIEDGGLRALKAKRTIDLDALFSPDPDEEAQIQGIYEDLIAERGAQAAREIALELEVNLQSRTVQRFIEQRKALGLDGALDTLMGRVRMSLAEGVGLNESLSELATRVGDLMDEARIGQALTVARTEVISAFNFASAEAWRQSGEVDQAEWLSARDSAVRPTHADADGQIAGLNEGFDVGGETLEYPGDPNGSPAETIQCRCVLLPVISERARRERPLSRYFPSKNGHAKPTNRVKEFVK